VPELDYQQNAASIVSNANVLARTFYRRMGNVVPDGYRFDKSRHPQEQMCWQMAADAFEQFFGTDLEEVLAELDDE
jgi:hypothetical protein